MKGLALSNMGYALLWMTAVACLFLAGTEIASAQNPIQVENQKAGTSSWQIGLYPYVNSNDTDQWIRGYADKTSINKGEQITFNITVNPYSWKAVVPQYTIDVYRVGWYGGLGGRLMKHLGPFQGVQQPGGTSSGGVTSPGCPYDSLTGMIACQWTGDGAGSGSYTLDTSLPPDGSAIADWTSGIYLALLTTNQVQYPTGCGVNGTDPCDPDHQSYIIFAIREDGRKSDILFQQAVATYQAYNNYPDDRQTGKSLYDGGSYGSPTDLATQRAVKVSFDRPYTYVDHTGAGDFLHWELYFVRWLERNGYDATYATDVDTHANGSELLNHKSVLSVGHAEYWSAEMRQAFETARNKGVSLGFFGANAVYTQIRFEPSGSNVPNRVMVCYKDANLDQVADRSLTTVPFRYAPVNRPEQQLLGVMYDDYFDAEAPPQSYIVQNSGNWIYSGTGFLNGGAIPGILGYEIDRFFPDVPYPYSIPGTYTLVSNSPFTNIAGNSGTGNSSIYQSYDPTNGTAGGWVFGAGTIDWSFALDNYVPPVGINTRAFPAPNAGAQKTTSNILNRFLIARPTGAPANLSVVGATNSGGKLKINLAWTSGTINQTGFDVERSTDGASFTQIGTTSASATTYSDTKAVAGVIYFYRVAGFNTGGNGNYSNVAVYDQSLAAPTGLAARALSTSQISLTWKDNSTDETGFTIQRSLDGLSFSSLTTVGANSTSFVDTGLAKNTKYFYRVQSFNNVATSAFSNTTSATTMRK
jgi:Fibronectin type III domain